MNVLREQRQWLDQHEDKVLDETLLRPAFTVQVESYAYAHDEIEALLRSHLHEIDPHLCEFESHLDPEFYDALDKNNQLYVITARERGKLVGYMLAALRWHPHYVRLPVLFGTLVYVAPAYRGRGLFGEMLDRLMLVGKALGVKLISTGTRFPDRGSKALIERGFSPLEITYIARL